MLMIEPTGPRHTCMWAKGTMKPQTVPDIKENMISGPVKDKEQGLVVYKLQKVPELRRGWMLPYFALTVW